MKEYLVKLENFLDLYLGQKAPQLPQNVKEIIVKYGPYLCLVGIALSLPLIFTAFGIGFMALPFAGWHYSTGFSFTVLITLAMIVIQAFAVSGLFKRQLSAWKLLYYVGLLSILNNPVSALISLYFLFQIKSLYR
jgi:hypothetical protein